MSNRMLKMRTDLLSSLCQASSIKQSVGGTTEYYIGNEVFFCDYEVFPGGRVHIENFLGHTWDFNNLKEFDQKAISHVF